MTRSRYILSNPPTAISYSKRFNMRLLSYTKQAIRRLFLRESSHREFESNGIFRDAVVLCSLEQLKIPVVALGSEGASGAAIQSTMRAVYTYCSRIRHIISLDRDSISTLIGIAPFCHNRVLFVNITY